MLKFSKDSVVLRFQKNLKSYDLKQEQKNAIVENKKEILDLNRSQIRIGIDSEGKTFGDYRSESYADFKKNLNTYFAKPPTPDLYVSGTLQRLMDLKINGQVDIISNDPMADEKTRGRFSEAFGVNKNIEPVVQLRVTGTFFENSYKILFGE